MLQNKLFKPFIYTLIIVGIVEVLGNTLHVIYSIMWSDMVMHFLGGFFVSLSAILVLTQYRTNFSYGQLLFYAVATAFVLGFLWELFELYFGITHFYSPDYWGDNGMDVVMDITGGLIAVFYSYFKIKNVN